MFKSFLKRIKELFRPNMDDTQSMEEQRLKEVKLREEIRQLRKIHPQILSAVLLLGTAILGYWTTGIRQFLDVREIQVKNSLDTLKQVKQQISNDTFELHRKISSLNNDIQNSTQKLSVANDSLSILNKKIIRTQNDYNNVVRIMKSTTNELLEVKKEKTIVEAQVGNEKLANTLDDIKGLGKDFSLDIEKGQLYKSLKNNISTSDSVKSSILIYKITENDSVPLNVKLGIFLAAYKALNKNEYLKRYYNLIQANAAKLYCDPKVFASCKTMLSSDDLSRKEFHEVIKTLIKPNINTRCNKGFSNLKDFSALIFAGRKDEFISIEKDTSAYFDYLELCRSNIISADSAHIANCDFAKTILELKIPSNLLKIWWGAFIVKQQRNFHQHKCNYPNQLNTTALSIKGKTIADLYTVILWQTIFDDNKDLLIKAMEPKLRSYRQDIILFKYQTTMPLK